MDLNGSDAIHITVRDIPRKYLLDTYIALNETFNIVFIRIHSSGVS